MVRRIKDFIRYTSNELENYTKCKDSCIKKINKQLHLNFPPYGLANFKTTLVKMISEKKIGLYDADLNGIILDVRNIKVLGNTGAIRFDDPSIHINIQADCYVFQPKIGSVVHGLVKHISQKQIGVIIYRVFSVPIRLSDHVDKLSLKLNSEIEFRIKNFDLQNTLPYIEGELIAKEITLKTSKKSIKFEYADEEYNDNSEEKIVPTISPCEIDTNSDNEEIVFSDLRYLNDAEVEKIKKSKKKQIQKSKLANNSQEVKAINKVNHPVKSITFESSESDNDSEDDTVQNEPKIIKIETFSQNKKNMQKSSDSSESDSDNENQKIQEKNKTIKMETFSQNKKNMQKSSDSSESNSDNENQKIQEKNKTIKVETFSQNKKNMQKSSDSSESDSDNENQTIQEKNKTIKVETFSQNKKNMQKSSDSSESDSDQENQKIQEKIQKISHGSESDSDSEPTVEEENKTIKIETLSQNNEIQKTADTSKSDNDNENHTGQNKEKMIKMETLSQNSNSSHNSESDSDNRNLVQEENNTIKMETYSEDEYLQKIYDSSESGNDNEKPTIEDRREIFALPKSKFKKKTKSAETQYNTDISDHSDIITSPINLLNDVKFEQESENYQKQIFPNVQNNNSTFSIKTELSPIKNCNQSLKTEIKIEMEDPIKSNGYESEDLFDNSQTQLLPNQIQSNKKENKRKTSVEKTKEKITKKSKNQPKITDIFPMHSTQKDDTNNNLSVSEENSDSSFRKAFEEILNKAKKEKSNTSISSNNSTIVESDNNTSIVKNKPSKSKNKNSLTAKMAEILQNTLNNKTNNLESKASQNNVQQLNENKKTETIVKKTRKRKISLNESMNEILAKVMMQKLNNNSIINSAKKLKKN